MNRSYFLAVLAAAGLCLCLPVRASEDSVADPFPEGFSFDDLPEIETLPEITPLPDEAQGNFVLNDDAVPAEVPNANPEEHPDEKIEEPAVSGLVSAPGRTIVQPSDSNALQPQQSEQPAGEDVFDKEKSLTETLKEDAQKQPQSPIDGTWVEKLTTTNPLSLLSPEGKKADEKLEEMVKNARNKEEKGKSNASVFDVAGVMLRMSLKQVERTLENRGFRKVNAKFQIPNFIKWRNEETCRNDGVVGYERLEACVIDKAKKAGHQYMQYLKYAKYDSKEEIEVYFTSNFTENKVYKIVYNSRIASITGNSPKAIYIRNIKVYDFWKKINQKYGQPDNKTTVTWGLGGNKPYLKAATGYLLLEDPMFNEMDYTRMSREDQRFINSDFYNF